MLVGPSGCGKSTLLRMIAGLEEVSEAPFASAGTTSPACSNEISDIAMVFQNYALYPHSRSAEHRLRAQAAKEPAPEREQRVNEAARILGLEELMDRKPAALAGGQRRESGDGAAQGAPAPRPS